MHFEITILGSGAGMPTLQRGSAAQVVNVRENFFLIDCGEATQLQLRKSGIRFQRIDHILISHLHGDHYLGLVGLLFTFHLLGRTKTLHIYAFPGLEELILYHCRISGTWLQYPVVYHELNGSEKQKIFENKTVEVFSFPVKHRIPCCGFLIIEKIRGRHIRKECVEKYRIHPTWMDRLKQGEDFTDESGNIIKNEDLTLPPDRTYRYACCSDTRYHEGLVPFLQHADVLYHEATFMHDKKDRAHETFHSTARQAAELALKAGAQKLFIGHFSARYNTTQELLEEAREIFPNTFAVNDLDVIRIY